MAPGEAGMAFANSRKERRGVANAAACKGLALSRGLIGESGRDFNTLRKVIPSPGEEP